jgi:hypothetical protein
MTKRFCGVLLISGVLLVANPVGAEEFFTARDGSRADSAMLRQEIDRLDWISAAPLACEKDPHYTPGGDLVLCTGGGFIIQKVPQAGIRIPVLVTVTEFKTKARDCGPEGIRLFESPERSKVFWHVSLDELGR